MKIYSIFQLALAFAGKARNNQELIADASGKLQKLNQRTQKIYIEYLADWPRADNYIHKLHKMQTALAEFLEKCGYDPISIIKFEQDWNVDLNGDGKIGKSRRRRRRRDEDYDGDAGSGDENFGDAVDALSEYWNHFFDNSIDNFADEVQRQQLEASNDFDFLFGNDVGGVSNFAENAANKIRKLFNGYKKFTAVYLSKCKKIDNVSQRVDNTVSRLNGAVRRYEEWLTDKEVRKEKENREKENQEKKKAKKSKKTSKRQLKMSKF